MGLRGYIAKRVASSFLLLIMAMSFNFYLFMVMPGDPTELFIPARGITREQQEMLIASFKRAWGLDKPFYVQFLVYLEKMFMWDFGNSILNQKPVAGEIMYRLPWTIILMGGSAVVAIIVGVALGVIVAYKRGSKLDLGTLLVSLITNSLPVFWLGMVFILIFCAKLGWFEAAFAYPPGWGITTPYPNPMTMESSASANGIVGIFTVNPSNFLAWISGYLRHWFLPILTLSVFQFGGFVLLTRATMLESLTEDYIITARAKGVPERSVLFRHALKNASLPIITSVALTLGFILSGAIITETVYSWPGLGHWIYRAVVMKDFFSMQAIFYIISLCVIIANVVADLLYGVVDPRIKYG